MIIMARIEDKYGRRFRTLRVSLLNHCNLGCVYCVAGDDADLKEQHATRENPHAGKEFSVAANGHPPERHFPRLY